MGVVDDVEVGDDAEDALRFFEVNLLLGNVLLGRVDLHVDGSGGSGEGDAGKFVSLSWLQVAGGFEEQEAGSVNRELERTRWDVGEEECAVWGGECGLARRRGGGEGDVGSGKRCAVGVGYGAGHGGERLVPGGVR